MQLQKRYTRTVQISQLNNQAHAKRYQLLCKKFKFEDPHSTAMIRRTAYVFDILQVRVNINGEIETVENVKQLQNKWESAKAALRKDHIGDDFENYLHTIDLTMYDKDKLLAFLNSDKMYGPFFQGLWLYDNREQIEFAWMKASDTRLRFRHRTEDRVIDEQYIFEKTVLMDYFKISEDLQHEILCLGLKKQ